jgi:hypothetical protein
MENKIPTSRSAHHLWTAEKDDKGSPRVRRSKLEPDKFDVDEESQSRTAAISRKIAGDNCAAYLGIFGATLVDDPTLNSEIPRGVVGRFNIVARDESVPQVRTWDELREAFGPDAINHIRASVSNGMQVRMASKYLDVPFVIAADIVDQLADLPKVAVKQAVDYLKSGGKTASSKLDNDTVSRVAAIFSEYRDGQSHKIAIDSNAEAYWTAYYGPFGSELVREVKKRVRADLASAWMRKNGVDSAASEYWSKYFGAYGSRWVSIVPKKLSPSK